MYATFDFNYTDMDNEASAQKWDLNLTECDRINHSQ